MDSTANSSLTHFPSLPPFPSTIPTAPLLRLSLQKLLDDDSEESTRLWEACRDVGFFYLDLRCAKGVADGSDGVERHVDGESLLRDADALFRVAEEFFGLPLEEKVTYDFKSRGSYFGYKGYGEGVVDKDGRKDRNEFYNISKDDILKLSDPLPQPALFNPYHSLISSYITTSNTIVNLVLTHLNKSLRLPSNTLSRIHRLSARSGDQVRFVRAPPQPLSDQQDAVGAHTDFGSVTLLFNRLGGLKILPPSSDGNPRDRYDESKWLWVQPLKGHCIVNLGDAMVKFTRGVLRSNIHKVVNPPGEQASGVRYSLVYFSRPEDDVVLKPLAGSDIIDARKGEVPDEQEEISSKEWILRRALGRRGVGEWSKSEGTESVRGMREVKVA